ncbi:photosystem I reaction center subunit VIII [Leptolyngbya sp. FACHB-261]|nr:photosystem I reaction center subunit VIII [Leptolyngbya sp. FACHB-261]MBD2102897.1 photosystem I reaction center subunit VIII [Leptolyngbya sp. FACHB-261]
MPEYAASYLSPILVVFVGLIFPAIAMSALFLTIEREEEA